jgi:para-aminobenzoate synthetase/4-amino-4-deoxychorismate lyase
LLWRPGQGYWLLDLHMERLADAARYFSYPLEPARVRDLLERKVGTYCGLRRVRLTVARDGSMTVSDAEYRPMEDGEDRRVVISGRRTDSDSVYLYHKTTRRELYDEERAQAVAAGYYEVIFENERGEITEGSISNIFIRQSDMYFTPPLHCGLLAGVFRRHFMAVHGDRVQEKVLFRRDLEQADEVYSANSVRGLVKVKLQTED